MFSRLYNRVTITGTLVAQTALYIGMGQDSFNPLAVQGSLLKDHNGNPYIPGSSIKGVLRSFQESVQDYKPNGTPVLSAYKHNNSGVMSCERGVTCPTRLGLIDKAGRNQRMKEWGGNEEKFTETIEAKSCMACRLFGSGVLAGKVKLRDARLIESTLLSGTGLRTGNAIERDTHTAVGGALFDTEFIPPGTEFTFKVAAENLTHSEAQTLGALLMMLTQGWITIGGRSRAGFGEVTIKDLTAIAAYKDPNSFAMLTARKPIDDQTSIASLLAENLAQAPEPCDYSKKPV